MDVRRNDNIPDARDRARGAFTMVEVMFAVGLTSLLFLAMYAGIESNVALVRMCRENQVATQLMSEQLELVRLYNWTTLISNSILTSFTAPIDPGGTNSRAYYTGTVAIAAAPLTLTNEVYATNMRQVTVTLNWTSGRRAQTRSMKTFVAKNGIHDYIATH